MKEQNPNNPKKQKEIALLIVENGLTVRDVENIIKNLKFTVKCGIIIFVNL